MQVLKGGTGTRDHMHVKFSHVCQVLNMRHCSCAVLDTHVLGAASKLEPADGGHEQQPSPWRH